MTATIARLMLPISLLCAVLALSLMGIGGRLPSPRRLSLLTTNSCALPCLFGVVPGETVRDGLPDVLARAPVSYLSYDSTRRTYALQQQDPMSALLVLINFDDPADDTVRTVQLYQTSPEPALGALGDFLLAGYRPSNVFTNCQNARQIVIVLGEDPPIFAQVALRRTFEPAAPVLLVGVSHDAAAFERAMVAFNCAVERRWMRFALLWKYLDIP